MRFFAMASEFSATLVEDLDAMQIVRRNVVNDLKIMQNTQLAGKFPVWDNGIK